MKTSISKPNYLREAALLFLRIGATAFGGPAAYIAIMQRETARRRHWVDDAQFLDLIGATNLIACPDSTGISLYRLLFCAGCVG